MKLRTAVVALVTLVVSVGCSQFGVKKDRYKDLSEKAINPNKVEVYYKRDGDVIDFSERRCAGASCDNWTYDQRPQMTPITTPEMDPVMGIGRSAPSLGTP